jgi:hypothetical protein
MAERNVTGVREDPIERVDRIIERLDDALRAAGFDPLAPASEPESVAEVERALGPYTLPSDLRRFWERVDFSSLRVTGWTLPEPRDPRTALETHRQNLEEARLLFGPPLLFPVARISGDQWSIELGSRWGPGGTVFSQDTGADELQIEYASFSDLLEVYAELIEEGCFQRREDGRASLDTDAELQKQEARLAAAPPHPLYGGSREIAADPARWPEHWLAAAGLDLCARKQLGATHTIAELVAESQQRPVTGRIRGEVVRLGGSSEGVLALVSDGDEEMFVFCPASATTWGPKHRGRYEFEVTVSEAIAPPDESASPHLFEGRPPGVVATAVRPLV